MTINLGDAWEAVADQLGDEVALRHGAQAETFSQFEHRASRLAGALKAHGVAHDTKVALYLYNANEYLEGCLAAFKLRAVPVNVNYRYLADELLYLLDNADAEAIIYHGGLADRVQAVRDRLPKLKLLVQVATTDADRVPLLPGAIDFEAFVAAH